MRFDWAGEPEAGRGGSAIRRFGTSVKELERLRAWLIETKMHGGGDGEHRFLLETALVNKVVFES
jgi:hypothetical protein